MFQFKEIKFDTSAYKEAVKLRYKLLREPLGLIFSNADLAKEKTETILGVYYANQLIGTVHLVPNGVQCKLRQMAILNEYQGKGIGKKLLNYTIDIAREKGYKSVVLHAREEAIGFYKKSGFIGVGNLFIAVNIPHLKMIKKLSQ
jgi:predicted GNAT family N-acyltransferase